jgi:hypothetical protein
MSQRAVRDELPFIPCALDIPQTTALKPPPNLPRESRKPSAPPLMPLYAHKPFAEWPISKFRVHKSFEIAIQPGKIHLRLKRGGEIWRQKSSR